MPNSYKYLDPDYTYADPQTGVMRNLHNITDRETLIDVETLATEKRAKELEITPIQLNLNPPDDAEVYERYMTGTVNGDVDTLAKLIFERLSE